MAGDYEIYQEELDALNKKNDEISQEDLRLIKSAVEKQNQKIKSYFKEDYLYYIAEFFIEKGYANVVYQLNLCLTKYKPASVRDIVYTICDAFEAVWDDLLWRKERFEQYQKRIEEIDLKEKKHGIQTQIAMFYEQCKIDISMIQADDSKAKKRYRLNDAMRNRISDELHRLEFPYDKISEMYNISKSMVSKLANKEDSINYISAEILEKLANFFHCSKEYILCDTNDRLETRMILDGEDGRGDFSVSFKLNNREVEKLIKYLSQHYNDKFVESLFIITRILNKADARYFIKLISILGKFVDRGRECEFIIPHKEGDEK